MAGDFQLDELRLAALGRREVIPSGVALVLITMAVAMLHLGFTPAGNATVFAIWLAAATAIVVATNVLVVAYALRRPGDREAVRVWQPIAHRLRTAINLVAVASPWVLLPGADPMLAAFIMMTYLLFLAAEVMATVHPGGQLWLALLGLPLSLAAFLFIDRSPYAWPLALLFGAASAALFAMNRDVRRVAAQRLDALATLPPGPVAGGVPPAPVAGGVPPIRAGDAADLTRRQMEVLRHLCDGLSNKEIARELGVAPATVKTHIESALVVMGASNRTEAAVKARTLGIV